MVGRGVRSREPAVRVRREMEAAFRQPNMAGLIRAIDRKNKPGLADDAEQ